MILFSVFCLLVNFFTLALAFFLTLAFNLSLFTPSAVIASEEL